MEGSARSARVARGALLGLLATLAAAAPAGVMAQAGGASPAGGQLGPAPGSTSWTFDLVAGAGAGGTPLEVQCAPGQCSRYGLNLSLPGPDDAVFSRWLVTLDFRCAWSQPVNTDLDCFAFSPGGQETGPGSPDSSNAGPNYEEVVVTDPASGAWSLRAMAAVTAVPTIATGTATLTFTPLQDIAGRMPGSGQPRFSNFDFPTSPDANGYQQGSTAAGGPDAGEPSLGINPDSGAVMFMSGNQVTRLTYSGPGPPRPTDVTPKWSQANGDAILFTDPQTHRTWAVGLLLAGSYLAISDDDGQTWNPGAAIAPPAAPDHETLGSGPYHGAAPAGSSYTSAVYYCAQTAVDDAYCARSDDGGMTFRSPATPLFGNTCGAIHGHVRVGPSGIVYVPNRSCTDARGAARAGVAVSVDNGASFKVSIPPDSSPGTSDPSVMEGPDGTVYFGYQAADGHPMVATATHDDAGTLSWRPSFDAGAFQDPGETEDGLPHGVAETEFPEVITGDRGRAAFAFLGSGRPGAYQSGGYDGTWYLFVSFTYDGGRTWHTVNATPNDPVQRGCIWNDGLVNACRNLLDFNDIGVDGEGHVYVAYTDGCTTDASYSCDTDPAISGWDTPTNGSLATGCNYDQTFQASPDSSSTCTFARVSAIVRQVCGLGLSARLTTSFHQDPACPRPGVAGAVTAAPPPTPAAAPAVPPSPGGLVNTAAAGLAAPAALAWLTLLAAVGALMLRGRRGAQGAVKIAGSSRTSWRSP